MEKKIQTDPPFELPTPDRYPEIEPPVQPENPVPASPEEDPDVIPEEDPYKADPYEIPPPGEGP